MSTDERVLDLEDRILGGIRAKEFFQFAIYNADAEHIVTLRLSRREGHTIGDLAQLQNFLWTQIGLAIREDPELQHRLRLGGIEVLLEDPNPPVAPADAS